MFFSVIIPTYNPKKYLNNILESITKSDCMDDIEVIISDDCSTEDFSDYTYFVSLFSDGILINAMAKDHPSVSSQIYGYQD